MKKEQEIRYDYFKVRNGLWRVVCGSRKISKHSMEEGARKMWEKLNKTDVNPHP